MKKIFSPFLIITICLFLSPGVTFAKGDKQDEKSLPPGLEKQQSRGKTLPPGWQKKLQKGETLDHDVYDQCEVVHRDGNAGTVTIETADKTIILIEKTLEIIDILEN
ncbi:hypothetical protein [Hahella ganghwensis]|uniref:hypothetical protein n=1 Tax=Hahella ganghwensis TaxID=286420 RepID=UPI00037F5D35|nr:hypothetical protein [Hahella ganghwensis]